MTWLLGVVLSAWLATTGVTTEAAPPARAPGVDSAAKPPATWASDVPVRVLEHLGSIHLGESFWKSPIEGVRDFAIDDRGRFGFIRACGCEAAFVLVDRDGKLVRSISLKSLPGITTEGFHTHAIAWLGGDRWLLTQSNPNDTVPLVALSIDAATGTVRRMVGFDSPPIERLAGTGDGGFVAVTSPWDSLLGAFSAPQSLTAFDGNGVKRWTVAGEGRQGDLGSSYDRFGNLAVSSSHVVVVVEDKGSRLGEYGLDGHLIRKLVLGSADVSQGYSPGPSLWADTGGGLLIVSGSQIARLAPDGTRIGTLQPTYPDGRHFRGQHYDVAPDGRLWTTDGDSLMRLDAAGRVDRVLGLPIDPDRLGSMGNPIAVSDAGRIHALDARTLSLHVFDGAGKQIRVVHADTKDPAAAGGWITGSGTGEVFVEMRHDSGRREEFVRYGSTGKLEGVTLANEPTAGILLIPVPDSANRWVLRASGLDLVDAKGRVLRSAPGTAMGLKFSTFLSVAAEAPDGSIVVVAMVPKTVPDYSEPRYVAMRLSRAGKLVASWFVPGTVGHYGRIANDGSQLALLGLADDWQVVVTDLDGKPLFRFQPPAFSDSAESIPSQVFLVKHGDRRELWLSDVKGTIERFAMPLQERVVAGRR